jgi:S-formylglutathione hydrolase FrmB
MALISCDFLSHSLKTFTSISVVIPTMDFNDIIHEKKAAYDQGTYYQVLYLLHGITGDHKDWLRFTSVERYAEEKKLALVLMSAQNSFYTDMVYGPSYWSYIIRELPELVKFMFPISDKREDTFIGGLSMGGYGALKAALRNPHRFAAAASISGALDIVHQVQEPAQDIQDYRHIFGDLKDVKGSKHDLFHLVKGFAGKKHELPKLYVACGKDDFLYRENLRFKEYCIEHGVELVYLEDRGQHDWDFWDKYIKKVIDWLPLKKSGVKVPI